MFEGMSEAEMVEAMAELDAVLDAYYAKRDEELELEEAAVEAA